MNLVKNEQNSVICFTQNVVYYLVIYYDTWSVMGASYIREKVKNTLQGLECDKYTELKKISERNNLCRVQPASI